MTGTQPCAVMSAKEILGEKSVVNRHGYHLLLHTQGAKPQKLPRI
ncbi:rCG30916 [Rattus norvegicus]|uniref:RCG30916 n=1 Tax=Rattus norvegicus TaxID=10116 RepID=A6IUF3_RAT|nr:rCG30916 [Rattus norvegicus]